MPPKYKKEDFLRTSYWSQRGKLDMPKERFVSYPEASPDSDESLSIGWAGVGLSGAGARADYAHRGTLHHRRLGCKEAEAAAGRAA